MKPETRFFELLWGKSVAIVGALKPDARIREYDLIVHLNSHWTTHRGRCDILYHNCCAETQVGELLKEFVEPPRAIIANFAPYARAGYEEVEAYCKQHDTILLAPTHEQFLRTNPAGFQHEWLNVFRKRFMFFPLQGAIACYHILLHPVRKVFLTGQNLYFDESVGLLPRRRGPHEIGPHVKYFMELQQSDARVEFDAGLRSALESLNGWQPTVEFNMERLGQIANAVRGTVTVEEVEQAISPVLANLCDLANLEESLVGQRQTRPEPAALLELIMRQIRSRAGCGLEGPGT